MSWRFVLDSTQAQAGVYNRDTYFKAVVIPSGYGFFTWNGIVFQNNGDGRYKQTRLTVGNLF